MQLYRQPLVITDQTTSNTAQFNSDAQFQARAPFIDVDQFQFNNSLGDFTIDSILGDVFFIRNNTRNPHPKITLAMASQ
ncbi:hypothetical protein UABAM_03759 [Candidatus Uabimicrobium amorphum]|uniref:Uncharacterized protein n=1 Tax=Uabimicrobium amorphum TaxID=2596890 RepID=A0A5S9F5L7_UABAM|nr:hypothetical protein UABAM_03759 [Candidatus Uabimicrobium amorphum]